MIVGEMHAEGTPQTSGKAIASMICGILGLLCVLPFVGALVGIILGHISHNEIKQSNGQLTGGGLAITGMVTGYMGIALVPMIAIMAGMMLPVLSKAREKARRVNDAGNQKQIGLALLMYSGDHDGKFPDNLAELVEQDYIQLGQVWICPSSGNLPPTSVEQLRDGSGTDYVYLGSGLKDDNANATSTVILHTKQGSFVGKWNNFLFIDGHVEGAPFEIPEEAAAQRGWFIGNRALE